MIRHIGGSLMGSWTYGFDSLNRLLTAQTTAGPICCGTFTWAYDSFGNRESEVFAGSTGTSFYMYNPPTYTFNNATNQADQLLATTDDTGNVYYDGFNHYVYDGEGRVCAVENAAGQMYEYLYDGFGLRIAKGTVNNLSCQPWNNSFTLTNNYIYGDNSEQLAEYDGSGNLLHESVLLEGKLLATYTQSTAAWTYSLNDWLGTKRLQIGANGSSNSLGFTSLPYGDALSQDGSQSATEDHFTGKDRDFESDNDYFGARYYSSAMGRFMSPDQAFIAWNLSNPQSFNLYSYVLNNPLSFIDPTGQDCVYFNNAGNGVESVDPDNSSQSLNQQASDCGANGGAYLNGTVNPNSVQYNSNTDSFNIQSSDALFQYNSTVTASGPNSFYGSDITNGVIDQSRTLSPQSTSGLFTYNDNLSNVLDMLKSAGVTPSSIDNRYNQSNHHGTQLRDDSTFCNLHVTIATGSGQNGAPVTGDYHYDTVNPWSFPVPLTTAAHGALDYFPDKSTGLHNASSQYVCNP